MASEFSQSSQQYLVSIDAEIKRLQLLRQQVATAISAEPRATRSAKASRSVKNGRRTMSPEGRRRVAEAQRARWAKQKNVPKEDATKGVTGKISNAHKMAKKPSSTKSPAKRPKVG